MEGKHLAVGGSDAARGLQQEYQYTPEAHAPDSAGPEQKEQTEHKEFPINIDVVAPGAATPCSRTPVQGGQDTHARAGSTPAVTEAVSEVPVGDDEQEGGLSYREEQAQLHAARQNLDARGPSPLVLALQRRWQMQHCDEEEVAPPRFCAILRACRWLRSRHSAISPILKAC